MQDVDEVTGSIGLLDEKLSLLTEREPCRFEWGVADGSWSVRVRSKHELAPAAGAFLVAIYDNRDRLMFALPIVGRPIGLSHAVLVGNPAS